MVRSTVMGLRESWRERVNWSDLLGIGLMSLAAPWIAAYIHSASVFRRGNRLYNAEVGGIYFHGDPSLGSFLLWILGLGVPAALTLLLLLPFRRRAVFRWSLWIGSILFWTWAFFKTEFAYH